ncbi:uncharacterized protein BDR25DRAFT_282552 [Lindgomyces ingoldianus]|uniref:Uncharacterized protein n=1 Tax=Lindgomyces ingoldianus TaxID=673940 RepID=A0ACB6R3X3_9PLEO|nr:uncharacterized protein BDR25DRAFT_282552 [Lindgomyces ingoldianus]KAF2473217.1 hypothetical protein BDR25DRAFT_282552 [Lindgomyces ingoldianus]
MPVPTRPGARPRPPRLESLNRPLRPGTSTEKPATSSSKSPPLPPRKVPPPATCCDEPNIVDDGSSRLCYNCGEVVGDNDIVAEVTFGENSAGAAVVQGGFIGDNQRYANTMGGAVRGLDTMQSREIAERMGRNEIQKLCGVLNLQQGIADQALAIYKLAYNHAFIKGRRIRNVAAVAIYLICRKRQHNTVLLMDFAEKIQVNVWTLGDTYKQLLSVLMIENPNIHNTMAVQEIEPLMLKFCQKLEFGTDSHRVAQDAAAILKRMNRDWMVQGRSPAGLCGACIILAARMNNFRRTVREVVYVVRVADTTITQRLLEFKRTQSSALTVSQFREVGQKLKVKTLPPAIYKRKEREERLAKRKRKLSQLNGEEEEEALGEQSTSGSSAQISSRPPKLQKVTNGSAQTPSPPVGTQPETAKPRGNEDESSTLDASAAQVLANPDDVDHVEVLVEMAEEDEYIAPPKRRGRPPKNRNPIIIPEEDLEIEQEIEDEIYERLEEWEEAFKSFEDNDNHPLLVKARNTARSLATQHQPNAGINTSEDIGEDEFEDDPDVAHCLLSEQERVIAERVWVTENIEWLRDQQKKMLQKALEEASGKPKKKSRRKHHQMGDGSLLAGRPAASAADAVKQMLERRAKNTFSEFINYDRLYEVDPRARRESQQDESPKETEKAQSEWTQVDTPDNWEEDREGEDEVVVEEEEEEEEVEQFEEEGQYYEEEEGFGGGDEGDFYDD